MDLPTQRLQPGVSWASRSPSSSGRRGRSPHPAEEPLRNWMHDSFWLAEKMKHQKNNNPNIRYRNHMSRGIKKTIRWQTLGQNHSILKRYSSRSLLISINLHWMLCNFIPNNWNKENNLYEQLMMTRLGNFKASSTNKSYKFIGKFEVFSKFIRPEVS